MNDSTNRLLEFITNEYRLRGGADDLETAIRDCLTDLCHINDYTTDNKGLGERLQSAMEVADEEIEALEAENEGQVNEG